MPRARPDDWTATMRSRHRCDASHMAKRAVKLVKRASQERACDPSSMLSSRAAHLHGSSRLEVLSPQTALV